MGINKQIFPEKTLVKEKFLGIVTKDKETIFVAYKKFQTVDFQGLSTVSTEFSTAVEQCVDKFGT